MSVHHPHDHFFRESFSKPQIIRNFLQEYLPPALLAQIDLDTLALESGSYIDEELRAHQTDLLYRVQMTNQQSLWLYLLFDHKSAPDQWVSLQLLRYMVRIGDGIRPKRKATKLPPILPLVIYHGEQKWQLATDFHALFEPISAELQQHIPQFHYKLHDFSHHSSTEIRGEIWLRVALMTLRTIFDPNLRDQFPQMINLIFQLREQKTGLEYIYTILYYLSAATERVDSDTMRQALLKQGQQGASMMATLAQQWINQGIEQGLEQGREQGLVQGREQGLVQGREQGLVQGRLAVAKRLLDLHDVVTVSELTGFTIETIKQLQDKDKPAK